MARGTAVKFSVNPSSCIRELYEAMGLKHPLPRRLVGLTLTRSLAVLQSRVFCADNVTDTAPTAHGDLLRMTQQVVCSTSPCAKVVWSVSSWKTASTSEALVSSSTGKCHGHDPESKTYRHHSKHRSRGRDQVQHRLPEEALLRAPRPGEAPCRS